MKKTLIVILALASFTRSYAQNPGYLGKHVMLTYNFHVMPRVGILVGVPINSLEYRHEAQASVILGRFTVVNATVQYTKDNSHWYNAIAPKPGGTSWETTSYKSHLLYTNLGIGLGISRYNILGPGPLAPIGNYVKGHVMVNNFHAVDTVGQFGYSFSRSSMSTHTRHDVFGLGFAIGAGIGRTRMVGEMLIIDYGLESDWTLVQVVKPKNDDGNYHRSTFRGLSQGVLLGHTFSFRVGIGGLLF
jgi:hypothetical protein